MVALPLCADGGLTGVSAWPGRTTQRTRCRSANRDVGDLRREAALALQVASARQDKGLLAVYEDRDRIGRDLHDLVIQRLFAIGLTLENAARMATKPEVATRITTAVDDIDVTIARSGTPS